MAYTIEQLPDEPIIILTNQSAPDEAELRNHINSIAALADQIDADHTYLIVDSRNVDLPFPLVIKLLQIHQEGGRGTASDPRITPVFVGSGAMIRLMRDIFAKHNVEQRALPLVQELDEALDFIRECIEIDAEERSFSY